jgi:ATP/maltotriose-dependent transcriptional regulator MalT
LRQSAAHGEALAHSAWVKLRVVRAICEAFADNIARSIAIVEPLLREVPCGDIWVDGLVCNILSYCHLADSRPQQALEVQQRVSGVSIANRNLFVTVYRAFVMAQSYLRQGNLAEAERQAARALRYAEQHAGENASSGATLAPILAEIAWEQGKESKRKACWFRVWRPSTTFVRPTALAAAISSWPVRPGKWGDWRKPNHYYCMPKDWRPSAAGCGRRLRCWRSGLPLRFTRATNWPPTRCCFACRP